MINTCSCNIHKQTFEFLKSIDAKHISNHSLKQLLYIVKFIYDKKTFTIQDLSNEFKINEATANKYLAFLKQIQLYKIIKRTDSEIETSKNKKYIVTPQPWIKEIMAFIKNKKMCPMLCTKD